MFEKYFMAHQYMPKIFHEPHKNSPAPPPLPLTYLIYGPLTIERLVVKQDRFPKKD